MGNSAFFAQKKLCRPTETQTSPTGGGLVMPGRAAFYPDAEIPLKNKLTIVMSDMNKTVYDKIISGQTIQYSATGMMTVESAWSIVELDFDTRS